MPRKKRVSAQKKSASIKRLLAGRSTLQKEADKCGVHVTSIRNWFNKAKANGGVKTVTKRTYKKKAIAHVTTSIAPRVIDVLVFGTEEERKELISRLLSKSLLDDNI